MIISVGNHFIWNSYSSVTIWIQHCQIKWTMKSICPMHSQYYPRCPEVPGPKNQKILVADTVTDRCGSLSCQYFSHLSVSPSPGSRSSIDPTKPNLQLKFATFYCRKVSIFQGETDVAASCPGLFCGRTDWGLERPANTSKRSWLWGIYDCAVSTHLCVGSCCSNPNGTF